MRILTLILVFMAQHVLGEDRKANHLQGAESPYLLQHLYNPVDWYPWGPEALEKAKSEGKLIFVSVGYASCHWCHVMAEESFENEQIAAFLNENYVSIKIDRESRPDLDAQFMLVTQAVSDVGGWPNTVFLTPDAAPFHGGTYYPPDAFMNLIQRASQFWQEQPETLNEQGSNLVSVISDYMTKREAAAELTPELSDQTARAVVSEVDPFNGGLGVAPKFPNEPLFLFLLDQAERQSDLDILDAATDLLDGMLMGGVHDQVGGGFHRYAVDPEWHVPHFEKMLYTQAMTGRLLVRAWAKTDEIRYKRAAIHLFDYVLRELRAPEGGFYSAQDADSLNAEGEKVEGAFFTWAPEELDGLGTDSAFITDVFLVSPEGDLEGRNVLNLSELPGDLATQQGLSEQKFNERLDPLLARMRAIRAERPAPATDEKILVDWNAAMIETLAEASHHFERSDYFDAASQAANYIVDEMMRAGKLSRVSFEGNIGVEAQLPDYAALGLAFLALHDFTPIKDDREKWITLAVQMADAIRTDFGAAESGYFTSAKFDGFTAQIPSNDSELPSGNALALALLAGITDRTAAPELELEALNLMAGLSGLVVKTPQQRASILNAANELQTGGMGAVRYGASGAVRVAISRNRETGEITIDLSIRDGWHVNSNAPLQDYLIATSLETPDAQGANAVYPEAIVKSLGFSDTPLSLYEGDVALSLQLPESPDPQALRLSIQACSDEICLSPEEMVFTIW